MRKAKFVADLKKFSRVGLDSSIAIYHLEDVEPYSDLTEVVFAAIAGRSLAALISVVCVTELLVKPFAAGREDQVSAFEHFIRTFPNTTLAPLDFTIAKEAARLRAKYALRTPDSMLVATALDQKADAFLTNDVKLRKLRAEGIGILVLDDYL